MNLLDYILQCESESRRLGRPVFIESKSPASSIRVYPKEITPYNIPKDSMSVLLNSIRGIK